MFLKMRPWSVVFLALTAFLLAWMTNAFTAGLVLLVMGIHEAGHVWAMRRCGMGFKELRVYPVFGMAVLPERVATTSEDEAFVFAMGPGVGGATSVLFLALSYAFDWPLLKVLAATSASMNAWNLVPLMPFDGGNLLRICLRGLPKWARAATMAMVLLAVGAAFLLSVDKGEPISWIYYVNYIVFSLASLAYSVEDSRCAPLSRAKAANTVLGVAALAVWLGAMSAWIVRSPEFQIEMKLVISAWNSHKG